MDIEQSRKLAQDEKTAPEVLAELAMSEDCMTRQNVAANPNTARKTLFYICLEFPSEVMNNPVVPLLILEDPYFLTCEINLDFRLLDHFTIIELRNITARVIKRLSRSKEQEKNYIKQHYGKKIDFG